MRIFKKKVKDKGGAWQEFTDDDIETEKARHEIIVGHRACETAPNGTGQRCSCEYDCANYWLRAKTP